MKRDGRNATVDRLALRFRCPECSAGPDEPCITRVSRVETKPHSRRIDRAAGTWVTPPRLKTRAFKSGDLS